MALRLVDIYHPDTDDALEVPDDTYDVLGHWTYAIDEEQRVDRVLLGVEETESFLDWV
ncbi:MAG: TIGR00341 family protein, partial [Bacteroidetes bacterium QS_4_64_154]